MSLIIKPIILFVPMAKKWEEVSIRKKESECE